MIIHLIRDIEVIVMDKYIVTSSYPPLINPNPVQSGPYGGPYCMSSSWLI